MTGRAFVLPALLGAAATVAGVLLAGASGRLIARAALRPEVFLSLTLLVTLVRALGVGRAALRYAERLSGHAAALRSGEAQRLALFDRLSTFGRDLLAHERSGDLLARSGADLDARQFEALRVHLPTLAFAAAALLSAGWLLSLDTPLGLALLGPLVLAATLPWAARRRAGRLARQEATLAREHGARLLDALSAGADGAAALHRPALAALAGQLHRTQRAQGQLSAALTLGREALFAVAVLGVLTRGAALVDLGALGGAWLAAVVLLAAAAFDALGPLALVPGAHAAATAARARAAELGALHPAVQAPPHPLALAAGPLAVNLRNVTVTRGGRTVLRSVTLHLAPGETVGLVGRSGEGKTTLARLLTRDLDPDSGQVQLGGADLRALDPAALRARLSLHEQDAPLLDGSVEENLRLGAPHAPRERFRALLDDLGLGHLHLSTWVGEGGARLSGGERARVSLARALLKEADVLILDEPTAHLDPATEAQVLRVIDCERAGRSLLLITHRRAPLALTTRQVELRAAGLHPAATPDRRAV
ncbi:ATP-binding cassette domain-containing protein (plasmid) [Deinococcus taeanensis]|uniref:ATP-binding cassette domain-containing protein n=1 Tax=Deinococcus taeanensis TaxID=2737050 RepID=UPI001CDC88C9|nr:ATP-binding cassette domain-containing protein [Deinococcus taeanensis]UBV44994.1 ATP-binding cassette domain-containing protein [Deinococcus taeanensis]